MDFMNPWEEIPRIHLPDEEYCIRSTRWPFLPEGDLGLISQPPSANRSVIIADIGLHSDTRCHNLPPMDPMDRFVQGFDSLPFSSEMLHTNQRAKDFAVCSPYESTVPELFYRRGSPMTAPSSPSQSCDTFSASHTDELHRRSVDFRGSISSPMDYHQTYFPHDSSLSFSVRPPELQGGGSVSLDQVQNFSDSAIDHSHTHSELDADCDSDHDVPIVRIMSGLPYTPISEDEGLGSSIPDSMSDRYDDDDNDEEDPEYSPRSAHRSPKGTRSRLNSTARRNSHGRKFSTGSTKGRVSKPKNKKPTNSAATRPFPCPLAKYGCQSTFTSKNEWKRHVSTQHIKLGFWRCDMCLPNDPNNIVYNDFNRKDLFTQHLRRMHATHQYTLAVQSAVAAQLNAENQILISDEAILAHQDRCHRQLRSNPPRSGCLFCSRTFSGDSGWDERMEHVGGHFEQERKRGGKPTGPESWRDDQVLEQWLVQEGLIEHEASTGWHIGSGQPLRHDSIAN